MCASNYHVRALQDDLYSLFEMYDVNHDGILQLEVPIARLVRGSRASNARVQEFSALLAACLNDVAFARIPQRKLVEMFRDVCSGDPGLLPGEAAANHFATKCRSMNVTPRLALERQAALTIARTVGITAVAPTESALREFEVEDDQADQVLEDG